MKIFIYKTLTIFLLFFIFYKLTIGQTINQIQSKINFFYSKENIENFKIKAREEIRNSLSKERYISAEDAELLNAFFKKIQKDLENKN
tara:strand:- start:2601 stop:2864 length:264 start_codon:yes stop_codon:yes gene_type:complete